VGIEDTVGDARALRAAHEAVMGGGRRGFGAGGGRRGGWFGRRRAGEDADGGRGGRLRRRLLVVRRSKRAAEREKKKPTVTCYAGPLGDGQTTWLQLLFPFPHPTYHSIQRREGRHISLLPSSDRRRRRPAEQSNNAVAPIRRHGEPIPSS
jgi:hypothetical protein